MGNRGTVFYSWVIGTNAKDSRLLIFGQTNTSHAPDISEFEDHVDKAFGGIKVVGKAWLPATVSDGGQGTLYAIGGESNRRIMVWDEADAASSDHMDRAGLRPHESREIN